MSIKAIAFDYGGVIVGTPSSEFNKRMCSIIGISEEEFLTEYYKINYRLNKEGLSFKELFTDLLVILGKEDKHDEVMSFLDPLFAKDKDINTPVVDLIKKLRLLGYKTAILSNNTLENAKRIHAEFDMYFDVTLVSIEIGAQKPEPEAFEKLFAALGVLPEETIFVDDSPKSLSTASDIGYHPILFTTFESLLDQLRELGVCFDG